DDIDAHYARVSATSAVVVSEPQDHAYGERQYAVADLAGHRWTFTQTVGDAAPEDWGGETIRPW
ncbi:MAG: VOC family protein, partial [Mycobacteriales bacterium]